MTSKEANALYGDYLEHSYRYYILSQPVISDHEFDDLCRRLLACWPLVTHRLKDLADESALRAGTGYQLSASSLPVPFVRLIERNPRVPLRFVFAPDGGL